MQQVRWALNAEHPMQKTPEVKAPDSWWEALKYETETPTGEVDRMREDKLDHYAELAMELLPQKEAWLATVPEPLKHMMRNVHGPLIARICKDMGFEDETFLERLRLGFPVAGMMDHSMVGMLAEHGRPGLMTLDALWRNRADFNAKSLSMMKETEHSGDLTDLAWEDEAEGWMTPPAELTQERLKDILISRRMSVREWKASLKKMRTRPVDHGSESGLKAATESTERTQVQGLEFLITMVLYMLKQQVDPEMWKRDLKSAFRNVPLCQEHAWCSWSAWSAGGKLWLSRHLAAPFGWVSSCI